MRKARKGALATQTGRYGSKAGMRFDNNSAKAGIKISSHDNKKKSVRVSAPAGCAMACLTPFGLSSLVEGGDVSKIEIIDLPNAGIGTAENMDQCKELKRLDLPSNKLSSYHYFEMNLKLCWMNLANNLIDRMTRLPGLSKLTVLNLSHNQLTEIGNLTGLDSLKTLILNNNKIRQVGNLRGVSNLETLILSHNKIASFGLGTTFSLPNLKKLSLGYNLLREVPKPQNIPALRELRLNSNRIQAIPESIKFLSSLRILDIGNTCLLSIQSVQNLSALRHLENLNLIGNEQLFNTQSASDKEKIFGDQKCCIQEFFACNDFPALKVLNSRKFQQSEGQGSQLQQRLSNSPQASEEMTRARIGRPDVRDLQGRMKEGSDKEYSQTRDATSEEDFLDKNSGAEVGQKSEIVEHSIRSTPKKRPGKITHEESVREEGGELRGFQSIAPHRWKALQFNAKEEESTGRSKQGAVKRKVVSSCSAETEETQYSRTADFFSNDLPLSNPRLGRSSPAKKSRKKLKDEALALFEAREEKVGQRRGKRSAAILEQRSSPSCDIADSATPGSLHGTATKLSFWSWPSKASAERQEGSADGKWVFSSAGRKGTIGLLTSVSRWDDL